MEAGIVIVIAALLLWLGPHALEPSKRSGPGVSAGTTRSSLRLRYGTLLAVSGVRLRIQLSRRRRVVVADEHSLLVVGPTRSGKTTRVVLPNLCAFSGSLVATSVKVDLLAADVIAARKRFGRVVIIGEPKLATHRWDPICEATDDRQAAALAHAVVLAQPSFNMTSGDTQFWYQLAEPIVAAVLRASQVTGTPMLDWIDEPGELYRSLNANGASRLADAVLAACALEDRQRDSVFLTARGLLTPLAHLPGELATIRVSELLDGETCSTFLVASAAEQEFLSVLFALLLSRIVALALERRRQYPLLLCLDELANLAPIPNLDRLAAIGVGQGVRLISIVQDLSQLESRYGRSANSIINNHASKLFMSPTSDPTTRNYLRDIAPDALGSRHPMFMQGSQPMVRLWTYSKTIA